MSLTLWIHRAASSHGVACLIGALSVVLILSTGTLHGHGGSHHHEANSKAHETRFAEDGFRIHLAASLKNQVSITISGDSRVITSNGIPDHKTGSFPNRNNPNTISAQNHSFKVPLNPKKAGRVTDLSLGKFGVALNGVPFEPGAAEFYNRDRNSGWQYEALGGGVKLGLDKSNAHVQPTGSYHYHGIPTALISQLKKVEGMMLVGYAGDGFPIYHLYGYSRAEDSGSSPKKMKSSYRVKKGRRPDGPGGKYDGSYVQDYEYVEGLGDLDECNGREGVTPEYPDGTYYYVLTEDFPFIPRRFRGTPDESFLHRGRGGGGPGGRDSDDRRGPPGGGDRKGPPPHHREGPPSGGGPPDRPPVRDTRPPDKPYY